MKIAILGTRGIPARYGGFETFAEHLSARLAARGHQITVYCRRPFTTAHDVIAPGVRRVILPTISRKHFDTAFHTLLSVIHVSFTSADVVLICNVANGPIAWIPRLFGKPTVLNVDGLDRKRKKWSLLGRSVLHFCEIAFRVYAQPNRHRRQTYAGILLEELSASFHHDRLWLGSSRERRHASKF